MLVSWTFHPIFFITFFLRLVMFLYKLWIENSCFVLYFTFCLNNPPPKNNQTFFCFCFWTDRVNAWLYVSKSYFLRHKGWGGGTFVASSFEEKLFWQMSSRSELWLRDIISDESSGCSKRSERDSRSWASAAVRKPSKITKKKKRKFLLASMSGGAVLFWPPSAYRLAFTSSVDFSPP